MIGSFFAARALGSFFAARVQARDARRAYQEMQRRAFEAQNDAADRAIAEAPYRWRLYQPPLEKRGGKWFAIIEGGPAVPVVRKRRLLPPPDALTGR